MTIHDLDDLLDASAPPTRPIDAADLRAMMAQARTMARRQRKPRRLAMLGAAVSLFALGGAGLATAAAEWNWISGLEDPDRSYWYTSPTWGECELRVSAVTLPDIFAQADVDRIVDEWFATSDVEAAAAPYVEGYLDVIRESREASGEQVSDPRQADLDAWTAHEQALSEALHVELSSHGYDPAALAGAESHAQLHCEGEDWGGEGGER